MNATKVLYVIIICLFIITTRHCQATNVYTFSINRHDSALSLPFTFMHINTNMNVYLNGIHGLTIDKVVCDGNRLLTPTKISLMWDRDTTQNRLFKAGLITYVMKCPEETTNTWALSCDEVCETIYMLVFLVPKDVGQLSIWYRNKYVNGTLGEVSLLEVHIEEYTTAVLYPHITCDYNILSTNNTVSSNTYTKELDNMLLNWEQRLMKSINKGNESICTSNENGGRVGAGVHL